MGVVLIMVIGMSSCSSDDEKKDDRYIITGQPSTMYTVGTVPTVLRTRVPSAEPKIRD